MATVSDLAQLVALLPEVYQPIFGHPELSAGASRPCDHRFKTILGVYERLAAELGRPPRVLDLGCAQGWFSLELAQRGASVRGIDRNAANIAVCRELAAQHPKLEAQFEQGDIEAVVPRLGAGEFDLALGLSVFHHLCERHGTDFVRHLLAQLIAAVPCALLELAVAGEPPAWSRALPHSPDELLEPIPFFRVISRHPTHLSRLERPLYFCSRSHWLLDELGRFSRWYRREGRRTYFGPESMARMYRDEGAHARVLEREAAFLDRTPDALARPRLAHAGAGEGWRWQIVEHGPGTTVADAIAERRELDAAPLLRQVLRQLVTWEQHGLFDLDLRAAHVVIGESGIFIRDDGSLVADRSALAWPPLPFVAFWAFVHELANRVIVAAGAPEPRHYRPEHLPEPYAGWARAFWALPFEQWSFTRLAESLPAALLPSLDWERRLAPLGYRVQRQFRPKYRGTASAEICTASKDGAEYFVGRDAGHFARLQRVQDSIPHMARIAARAGDCVLFHRAAGRLLWDFDSPPELERIEAQLYAFAEATRRLGLMHADLRPWNVFYHPERGVEVIDWGHGGFVDEMRLDSFTLSHIRATHHSEWALSDLAGIDLEDARRLLALLKGEIGLGAAWGNRNLPWLPPWCRP